MNITLSYQASTLAEFVGALDAIQARGFSAAVVTLPPSPDAPSGHPEPVQRFMVAMKQKRYKRTEEGSAKGLTALEDLQARADGGDVVARKALIGPSADEPTVDTPADEPTPTVATLPEGEEF